MEIENISPAKVYVVSLQKGFYLKGSIKGCESVEITEKSDIDKISDGDMIFFLSSEDISGSFMEEIKNSFKEGAVKIAVSSEVFKNLGSACSSTIVVNKDLDDTYRFLRSVIEGFTVPGLVGLDYSDVARVFKISPIIFTRLYVSEHTDAILTDIKKEFKKMDSCFFVIEGGKNLTIDIINNLEERISEISGFTACNAFVDESQDRTKVMLFAGCKR